MNNRILELTVKTDAWCDQNLPSNWTDDVDKYLPLWNEKFAELIVGECIICAEREWIHNGETAYRAVSKVIGSIKQHFGVE